MNSLYFQQTRSLLSSVVTILVLVMTLFLIAQSAVFLSVTLESGLSPWTFINYILLQIPVQITNLLPLCIFAACITTFNAISMSGEHVILKAAGVYQASYFRPAQLAGVVLFFVYTPFLLDITPWANRSLSQIQQQSREQVAQNTLINPQEPTYIGEVEVYVQETENVNLNNISLFGQDSSGREIFISSHSANFTQGNSGIALMMHEGQVLQSNTHQPQIVQRFSSLLIDLAPLIKDDQAFPLKTTAPQRGFFDLFVRENRTSEEIRDNQQEAGRRLAYLCLTLVMPSWMLFWQLLGKHTRGRGPRIAHLGPVLLVPVLIILQSPSLYVAESFTLLAVTLGLVLCLGLIGPFYFTGLTWNLRLRGVAL